MTQRWETKVRQEEHKEKTNKDTIGGICNSLFFSGVENGGFRILFSDDQVRKYY